MRYIRKHQENKFMSPCLFFSSENKESNGFFKCSTTTHILEDHIQYVLAGLGPELYSQISVITASDEHPPLQRVYSLLLSLARVEMSELLFQLMKDKFLLGNLAI